MPTLIVGRFLGENALAAVGGTYTLMTFLCSIIIGLCMGSGSLVSYCFGERNERRLKGCLNISFLIIGSVTLVTEPITLCFSNEILKLSHTPMKIMLLTSDYVRIILSGVGLCFYTLAKEPLLRLSFMKKSWKDCSFCEVVRMSTAASVQQSVMNFGILMVQGIVNSFGTQIMAAFAVSVKIDTIAYMPVQDFGNAFSTFIAQNFGAGKYDRIKDGIKKALKSVVLFCIFISAIVFIFAKPLMMIFVNAESTEIINIGVQYLRIEGACYIGIGILFMLYGYYRAINKPSMSVVLTVISLGIRVVLAYVLSRVIGVVGIWWSIPIGWFIADAVGICFYLFKFDR